MSSTEVSDRTVLMANRLLGYSWQKVNDIPNEFPPLEQWLHQLSEYRYPGAEVLAWLQTLEQHSVVLAQHYKDHILTLPDYDQHTDYLWTMTEFCEQQPGLLDLLGQPDVAARSDLFKQLLTHQYTYSDLTVAQLDYEIGALTGWLHYLHRTDLPKE
jgi:hypothetical protein